MVKSFVKDKMVISIALVILLANLGAFLIEKELGFVCIFSLVVGLALGKYMVGKH